MQRRWLVGARPYQVLTLATDANGRADFVFDPAFEKAPDVDARLMFSAAAGCTFHFVGEPTKTGCTIEVRKPKALVLGLVGVAHEPAPNVTVRIRAEQLDA